jgi:small redox-active disulfide protein 2
MGDIKMIRVAGRQVGVLGLDEALEELGPRLAEMSEGQATEKLLERMAETNYIPDVAREAYAQSLRRELCKHLDRPFEEDKTVAQLDIQVLGTGCPSCEELTQRIMRVLDQMNLPAGVEHVRDMMTIATFGQVSLPGLCINGEVVASGQVPSEAQLKEMINKAR